MLFAVNRMKRCIKKERMIKYYRTEKQELCERGKPDAF